MRKSEKVMMTTLNEYVDDFIRENVYYQMESKYLRIECASIHVNRT